ncbi:MAG: hypothetical protein HQL51_05120 [Magnetococcales bacterium]|nr:hypothetical protein [Magnetococcales bacterium]
MDIARIQTTPEEELLSRLRQTRLKGHGQPLIYQNARLELARQMDPRALFPAQRYVLREDFVRLEALHQLFKGRGVDIFALEGAVWFHLRQEDGAEGEAIPLLPPVVEMSREPDGRTIPLINDGMHRVYAALRLGKRINVVMVHDVPEEYPYYAHALPNGWDDVTELDALPDDFVKKSYRDPQNYKALFRDFNAVFPGVQKQRKQSNPASLQA